MAGRAPRRHGRDLGQVRQEGERDPDRRLQGGGPRGAPLRLDRRPHQARRRRLVHPALHAAARAQPLVEDQLREGGGADRERRDAARGAGRGRAREGRRPLGGRLRRAEHGDGARRPARGARPRPLRRASCSSGSTRRTATRSCTGCRTRRSPRRGRGGSRSSWRCSAAARRSTRCAARRGSGASSCGRRTRPSSTSGGSRCGCGRGRASGSCGTSSAVRAGPSGGGRPRRPRSATAAGRDDARSTPRPPSSIVPSRTASACTASREPRAPRGGAPSLATASNTS